MIPQLIREYGKDKILKYITTEMGSSLLQDKFSSLSQTITNKFNSKIPFDISNVDQFDAMIDQVNQVKNSEVSALER